MLTNNFFPDKATERKLSVLLPCALISGATVPRLIAKLLPELNIPNWVIVLFLGIAMGEFFFFTISLKKITRFNVLMNDPLQSPKTIFFIMLFWVSTTSLAVTTGAYIAKEFGVFWIMIVTLLLVSLTVYILTPDVCWHIRLAQREKGN